MDEKYEDRRVEAVPDGISNPGARIELELSRARRLHA